MNKIGKIMASLLISVVFVMPISAMQNEAGANNDNPQHHAFVAGEFIIKFTENTAISSLSLNKLNNKYQVFSMDKVFKNAENTILEHIYKFYAFRPGILRGLERSGRPADERPAHLFNIQPDGVSVARGRP